MGSKVKWVRLGDYTEVSYENNRVLNLDESHVIGLSTSKYLIKTKANLIETSLSGYKLFRPNEFAYVTDTSRRGEKVSLGYNNTNNILLVSSVTCVFRITRIDELHPEYLYLLFLRPEFDRYSRYNSWGSAREFFVYEDICRMQIPLPSPEEQQKVVNVWKACREIKEQNEAKAAPLMQVCLSYIQELKHKFPMCELGEYIEESNERNKDGMFNANDLMGVCSEGTFIKSIANTQGLNFGNYKVVHQGDFAYSNRINVGSIALRYGDDCIISPSYAVFRIKKESEDVLLKEYLAIWFRRSEFLRSTLFFAFGTIKDDFSHREMCRVKIPLPPIDVQRAIVNIYKCANEAKQIAEEADKLSRAVCPALIQHLIKQ